MGEVVLVGLTALAVVLAVRAVHVGSPSVRTSAVENPLRASPSAQAALFIGDDYTDPGGGMTNSFAQVTAKSMSWVLLRDGQAGTGFVANGQQRSSTYGPYYSRLPRDKAELRPDYVIVTGGRNDGLESSGQVVKAATSYLRSVRESFPNARLVIVAPFWVDSRPPATLLALRDAESALARSLHAAFIDPLGQKWITNANWSRYIAANRSDPTVDGHNYLAGMLITALKKISWPAPPAATPSVTAMKTGAFAEPTIT